MDYALVHAVQHGMDPQQHVITFYDINCQYNKNLATGLKETILYLSLTVYKSSLALASGMYMVTRLNAFPSMLLILFQELAGSMGK